MQRLLFLALVLTLTAARPALSCDCVTLSPRESFNAADIVFQGEVIRVTRTNEEVTYTFRVSKTFKGPHEAELTIVSGHTNCDDTFFENVVYLVYVHCYDGKLMSGVCAGNKVLQIKKAK